MCRRWHMRQWWWRLFPEYRRNRHRRLHHGRPVFVVFVVRGKFGVLLKPNEELIIMTDITLGQGLDLSISYLDQNGSPMLTTPAPDAPPTWSNTTPATETIALSADGLTAHATTVAPGSDTISVSVVVGGATYAATLGVN